MHSWDEDRLDTISSGSPVMYHGQSDGSIAAVVEGAASVLLIVVVRLVF